MNILITGASSGVGFELAQIFLENQHNVLTIARNEESLEKLKLNFQSQLNILKVDITTPESLNRIVHKIETEFESKIDVLINNAGLLINKTFSLVDNHDFDALIDTNLKAPFFLIQKLVPFMHINAQIMNIGSMGGYQGSAKFKGLSVYSATKAALACLTECLAEELKENKIMVNCVALGAVDTPMLQKAFPQYNGGAHTKDVATYIYSLIVNNKGLLNGKILPITSSTP